VLAHLFQLSPKALDAAADESAIGLDLGLAGPTGTDAAAQAFQVGPLACQAGQQILVLGQFYLDAALPRLCATREDV